MSEREAGGMKNEQMKSEGGLVKTEEGRRKKGVA